VGALSAFWVATFDNAHPVPPRITIINWLNKYSLELVDEAIQTTAVRMQIREEKAAQAAQEGDQAEYDCYARRMTTDEVIRYCSGTMKRMKALRDEQESGAE
jgi:hypothetical protein